MLYESHYGDLAGIVEDYQKYILVILQREITNFKVRLYSIT